MKAVNLGSGPYHFKSILSCRIEKTVNSHFRAEVSGYTADSVEEALRISEQKEPFVIYAEEEGEKRSIFRGKVRGLHIRAEGELKIVTVRAESNTCLLDGERHTRAFQDPDWTYRDIVRSIAGKEKASVIYYAGKSGRTGGLTVQYEESDWEFLKRLAARAGTVLTPDCTNDSICFYFGIPDQKEKAAAGPGESPEVSVIDADGPGKRILEFRLVSREIWELCTPVEVMGTEALVYSIQGRLEGEEMIWDYRLRRPADFEPGEAYNARITGASLFGRVTDTRREFIRLKLECGDECTPGNAVWYPFATVYTSPDGNGWYFMPEKGERARLCFPDKKEKHAYAVNSAWLEDAPGRKNDPDVKFIRTSSGKEIRLAPDSVLLTNHKGMSVRIDDKKGIEIRSRENIDLNAEEGISLSSGGSLKMDSESGIVMNQGSNSITIRDGICVNGTRVRLRR